MNYETIAKWALGEDTGLSSKFLAACALGDPELARLSRPYDGDDFGRCYRLSRLFTTEELADALTMAADCDKYWAIIASHWDELCACYETKSYPDLYKLMKSFGL